MINFKPLYAYAERRAKTANISHMDPLYLADHLCIVVFNSVREFVNSRYPGTLRRFVHNRVKDEIERLRKTCMTTLKEEPDEWVTHVMKNVLDEEYTGYDQHEGGCS